MGFILLNHHVHLEVAYGGLLGKKRTQLAEISTSERTAIDVLNVSPAVRGSRVDPRDEHTLVLVLEELLDLALGVVIVFSQSTNVNIRGTRGGRGGSGRCKHRGCKESLDSLLVFGRDRLANEEGVETGDQIVEFRAHLGRSVNG
jgi:hypothetical protein